MGLIRILILLTLGYFIFRLLKHIFLPRTQDKGVQGESKTNKKKQYKNIEDADYEEID